jgi:hypothetical protein
MGCLSRIRCHGHADFAEQVRGLQEDTSDTNTQRLVFITFSRNLLIARQRSLRRLQVAAKGL